AGGFGGLHPHRGEATRSREGNQERRSSRAAFAARRQLDNSHWIVWRSPAFGTMAAKDHVMPLDPTSLLGRTPVIPVLTIESAAQAVPLARALLAGGLPVLEVTLRTAAALAAVKAIAAEVPQAVVGVGTVTGPADIDKAVAAGARFLVSPGTTTEI